MTITIQLAPDQADHLKRLIERRLRDLDMIGVMRSVGYQVEISTLEELRSVLNQGVIAA